MALENFGLFRPLCICIYYVYKDVELGYMYTPEDAYIVS